MSPDQSTVLVVDDEQDVADLYAMWLQADYRVLSAYEGDEALEVLDDTDRLCSFLRVVDEFPDTLPGGGNRHDSLRANNHTPRYG